MSDFSVKNKQNEHSVHFIGILGASMLKLAKYTKSLGFKVSGSDTAQNVNVKELETYGIRVYFGHKASNVINANVVVYSSAVSLENCELKEAKKRGLQIFSRGEYLAKVARSFKYSLAVAGSHGKSTTAAMIASIFRETDLRPFTHIGGELDWKENEEIDGELIILEACEYKGNFLRLTPDVSVITNVELDHTDYYKSEEDLNKAFYQFARQTKRTVICDLLTYNKIKNKVRRALCVGDEENSHVKAQNLTNLGDYFEYEFWYKGNVLGKIRVNSPFIFNVKNSLFAILACLEVGVPFECCQRGIWAFSGVKRRQEVIKRGAPIFILDYAHHPSQINNVAQSVKGKRTLAVFQSHTYTRTRDFLQNFASALKKFDHVIIMPTYPAREEYIKEGGGMALYYAIDMENKHYAKDKESLFQIIDVLQNEVDVVLFLGAGDIDNYAREYCNEKVE